MQVCGCGGVEGEFPVVHVAAFVEGGFEAVVRGLLSHVDFVEGAMVVGGLEFEWLGFGKQKAGCAVWGGGGGEGEERVGEDVVHVGGCF